MTTATVRVTFNDVVIFAKRNKLLALRNPVRGGNGIKIVHSNVTHWADVGDYYAPPEKDCIRFPSTKEAIAFIHGWRIRSGR